MSVIDDVISEIPWRVRYCTWGQTTNHHR